MAEELNQDPGQEGDNPAPPDPTQQELAQLRKDNQAFKRQLDEQKRASMTEAERHKADAANYKSEAEKYRTENQGLAIRHAVHLAAMKAGAHDPETVAKVIDSSSVTVGEDGKISGVDAAIAKLKKEKAYFFQPQPRDNVGSGGGNIRPTGSGAKATADDRAVDDMIRSKIRR